MEGIKMMKNNLLRIVCGLAFIVAANSMAAEQMLEMTVSVGRGSGDDPMVVAWVETDTGDFVKTIHMFSKDKEYFKDMLAWRFKSRKKEKLADVDGLSGATIKWKRKKTIQIPMEADGINLLDGNYVLRIESRKWKGKHYRNFKIPLPKGYQGGTHENSGYVKSIEIIIKVAKAK
jgi:hypothetical protein